VQRDTCPFFASHRRRWLGRLIAACFLWFAGGLLTQASAALEEPTAPVAALHQQLLSVMKAGAELGFQGRLERLLPVVQESFDIPLMTQVSVGSTWRSLTEEDRALLISLFTRFTAANYAANFDHYNGQRFDLVDSQIRRPDRAVVETRLIPNPSERDPIDLHYLLQKDGDNWRVVDVLLKGRISQLAARRSEFASILRRTGADGLAEALREKIQALAGSSNGNPTNLFEESKS